MAVTLEQIEKYADTSKQCKKGEINCGDFSVIINTNLSIEEQKAFVDEVFKNAYMEHIIPSSLYVDVAFSVCFMQHCTDITMPTEEVDGKTIVDTQKAYDIAEALNLPEVLLDFPVAVKLRRYVNDMIEHQNAKLIAYVGSSTASDEAIETFSGAMNGLLNLINVGVDLLEKSGTKISKNLTPKKIQSALVEFIKAKEKENADDGKVVAMDDFKAEE